MSKTSNDNNQVTFGENEKGAGKLCVDTAIEKLSSSASPL